MKVVAVASLVLVLLLVARPGEAISCEQVSGALAPCVPFLTGGGSPSQSCCAGVQKLRDSMSTQQDRRTACRCVKSAAAGYPNIKPDAASNLPGRCGVPLSIPISASTNCDSIP